MFLSTAGVMETLMHMQPVSTRNAVSFFPLQFKISDYTAGSPPATKQASHLFKIVLFLDTQNKALVLKY